MPLTITFALSGLALVALIAIKQKELNRDKSFFSLGFISKSDAYVRESGHKFLMFYDSAKEKGLFLWRKQLPLRAKSLRLKFSAFWSELGKRHLHKIRDSKILPSRREGISEFFGKLREEEESKNTAEQKPEKGSQKADRGLK